MNINHVEFISASVKPEQYPKICLPEIALAGRSNVGKSSLINMLTNRKNLAKTAKAPGKTRSINFYRINDMMLVDLPGYGYAKVSKAEKQKWRFVDEYLNIRENLKAIIIVVDVRRIPSNDDIIMFDWARQKNIPYIITAGKIDTIKRSEKKTKIKDIINTFGSMNDEEILLFSSVTREGKKELLQKIEFFTKEK